MYAFIPSKHWCFLCHVLISIVSLSVKTEETEISREQERVQEREREFKREFKRERERERVQERARPRWHSGDREPQDRSERVRTAE